MVSLTENLRNEHKEILKVLNEIRSKGLGNNESRIKFFDLKGVLLEHIRKEDEEFYPALNKVLIGNSEMNEFIMKADIKMRLISMQAYEFFQKYDIDPENVDFMEDISKLIGMLIERIKMEEEVLYPKLDSSSSIGFKDQALPKPPVGLSF